MAITLTGSPRPLPLGPGYSLRAPGFRGGIEVLAAGSAARSASRALDAMSSPLDSALREEGVTEVKSIELTLERMPGAAALTGRAAGARDEVELAIPDLGDDVGQIVVSIDDVGAVRWHLPEPKALPDIDGARGAGPVLRFRISAAAAPASSDGSNGRSLFGLAARRLLKVLVYPVTDPIVGAIADTIAARFEARKHPYRLRTFTAENHASADAAVINDARLAAMCAGGPVLLFVHGTFSTSHGGFGDLPAATVAALCGRYDGRVIAFDHPTLSQGPDDNVRWLLSRLPADARLDIICHSRGGLVSRVLAEGRGLSPLQSNGIEVRRVIFAGTPNNGTALADPDHMVSMIDRFTTALTLAPSGPAIEILEGIVTVVKTLGHGSLRGLDGLSSMHAGGEFLAALNSAGGRRSRYFAFAADYEPTDRGLRSLVIGAADAAVDRIFQGAGNDLVVPTEGVWQKNGGDGFPLDAARRMSFDRARGVMHTTFFQQPAVSGKLLEWLA